MEAVKSSTPDLRSKVGADDVDVAALGAVCNDFNLPMLDSIETKRLLDGCRPERVDEATGLVTRESWLVVGSPGEPVVNRVRLHAPDDLGLELFFVYDPEWEVYVVVLAELADELVGITEDHGFTWVMKDGKPTGVVTVAKKGEPIIRGRLKPDGTRSATWVNRFALDTAAQNVRADRGEQGWWPKYELVATKSVSDAAQGDTIMRQALRAYVLFNEDSSVGRGTVHEVDEPRERKRPVY